MLNQNSDGQKYKLNFKLNLNDPNNSLVKIFNYITDNATVLDVGCACGDFGVFLKEHKNATMYGIEYNMESARIAFSTNAYEEVNVFDLDALTQDDFPQYRSKFDFIACGDILEHLRNPVSVLTILKSYLKEGGYILASIPNVAHMSIKANLLLDDFTYKTSGLLDETHIHLFTYKTIAKDTTSASLKIEDCGFTVVDKFGWHPETDYTSLPKEIKEFLYNDWHSYVCQYIIKMSASSDDKDTLFENNLNKLDINETTAPFNIVDYRGQLLYELYLGK